jgi:hypothetical protein
MDAVSLFPTIDGHFIEIEDGESAFRVLSPLGLDPAFNPNNFRAFILRKRNVRENEIFQVIDKKLNKRVGWCFPVQALNSVEHSFTENPFFLRYATVAARIILSRKWDGYLDYKAKPNDFDRELSVADFFHPSSSIFVVSLEATNGECQSIRKWLPDFALYGYVACDLSSIDKIQDNLLDIEGRKLKIDSVSSDLEGEDFALTVLCEDLPFESNPVLRFFLVYQIFELLMERIMRAENKRLIDDLILNSRDALKVKSLLIKINEGVKEEKRINLLNSKYTPSKVPSGEVSSSIDEFFIEAGIDLDKETSISSKIYYLRNTLFHGYRNVRHCKKLEGVVSSLIPYLTRIFCAYAEPTIRARYSGENDFVRGLRVF